MFDSNSPNVPKAQRRFLPGPQPSTSARQQRLMVVALALLVVSLGFILYRDRDFWFPATEEAVDQPLETVPTETASAPTQRRAVPAVRKKAHAHAPQLKVAPPSTDEPNPPATVRRTVLPPLEVEVVAGSVHRTVRPGSNSVKIDLQSAESAQRSEKPSIREEDVPAGITTNAAEHIEISAEPAEVVSHSVQPGYPLLARQMKVQGSVILQALIGRDGLIQDLRVLSGPPILANAAQEAVKQWRFKPHYAGSEAVETQAKITVNFTISTN